MIWATLGGVTIGLALLIRYLIQWWPGLKSLQAAPLQHAGRLLPFLAAWCYGALAILGVGGLVGWFADSTLWITNWLGDAALVWGVGGQAGVTSRGAAYLPLTQTGGALVLLMTVALLAAAKKSSRGSDLKAGAWCGICLGTSAGIAGFAAVPLAQAANAIGGAVYGAIA
ncbi:hypothetical protein GTY86_35655 [Streptomyces sp. SID5770]|uniref:hypothetical protein n=1 Tax=unclassified Streptomyces TaxID=2593676 RepID=UPI00136F6AFD|nr:hypothetical protein [Streptomyces sp. SID5770]MZE53799.1 hypothetical protein [Streptomyces sp. SID5770]MZE56512.1 hypothetical protein [Streptomyces sp. SID5770]